MNALGRLSTALRTVTAAALVVAAAGLLVRGVEAAFDPFQPYPGHAADYGVDRPRAIRAALPSIASRPEDVALLLGSSGAGRAFVPSSFDEALARGGKRYVSYNLAQVLLQPETALAMAKVIRRTFEEHHKRIGIAIFGISVPELARGARRAAQFKMPDQAFTFATADTIVERAHSDPSGAFHDGAALLLFGNVRTERIASWIEDAAKGHPLGCNSGMKQPVEGPEAYGELVSFCDELRRQFPRGIPPWNPETRGRFDFGLPATRPMLERLIALQPSSVTSPPPPATPPDPSRKAPDDIDEDAVRMLVEAVRELGAVSDKTIVLRDILNPALIAPLPPAQVAHWRVIAERVAHEGDARLVDMNDGAIVPSDFGDPTHLNPLAAERFSAALANRVRPMVQENHALR